MARKKTQTPEEIVAKRGYLAGLKEPGMDVAVLERVWQVGSNRQGAKGS